MPSYLFINKFGVINTNALNEMLKPVQHDKKKYVIPNLFRNLEFGNDKLFIAFVLVRSSELIFKTNFLP